MITFYKKDRIENWLTLVSFYIDTIAFYDNMVKNEETKMQFIAFLKRDLHKLDIAYMLNKMTSEQEQELNDIYNNKIVDKYVL